MKSIQFALLTMQQENSIQNSNERHHDRNDESYEEQE